MNPRDLYGLPLERFTEDRNALAKQLRGEGRRDEAAEVSKLRKPSAAAWAVNQLVRTQRRGIDTLFDAGDMLQNAQAALLTGQAEPGDLRTAVEAERAAVDQLTEKVRGLLSSEGHDLTAATRERVSETLHAAALDQGARTEVQDGCLHRELRHVGLGAMAATTTSAAGSSDRPQRAFSAAPTSDKRDRARQAQERAARLKAARKVETDTRRQAERASRDLVAARQQRDQTAQKLGEAEETLVRARQAADEAAGEHRQARAALDEL
jgi:hypothetical protein